MHGGVCRRHRFLAIEEAMGEALENLEEHTSEILEDDD
jgi:hypothetical protein